MFYTCFNCNNNIDIPDYADSPAEATTCPNCFTNLYLEIYKICNACKSFYLKTSDSCLNCFRSKRVEKIEANYIYISSQEEYNNAVTVINEMKMIALDTETNGLDPFDSQLLLIQIGDEEIAYIFDYSYFEKLSQEEFWDDSKKTFIIHNAKFDMKMLKSQLNIKIQNIFDTMLGERILTMGISRNISLQDVTKKYLNMTLEKDIREEFSTMNLEDFKDKISKDLLDYSALDVQVLPLIAKRQKLELNENGLMKITNLEFDLVKVIAKMELAGIFVDKNRWKNIIHLSKKKKVKYEKKIYDFLKKEGFKTDMFGELRLNLNSTKVIKEIFSHFNIHLESTGEAALNDLKHPIADLLREYRKYEKQISAFGENFLKTIRKKTSRVHPNFGQIGADTGRFSCSSPNLQQIPATEEYRSCFRAPKTRKIITCDYSQQELRLLASLSRDKSFIKMYNDGVDLHSATASMMFKIPIKKVEKDHHRKIAKTINFGLVYGRGPKSLAVAIGVKEDEAKDMIKQYFSQFSSIKEWLEKTAEDAISQAYSKTLMGRKRFYKIPDKANRNYHEELSKIGRRGKNTPIQGSAVDMIKLALIQIDKELQKSKLDAFIINSVHDEIVVECSKEDAKRVEKLVEKCMVEAGESIVSEVPIIAEACIEDYWTH